MRFIQHEYQMQNMCQLTYMGDLFHYHQSYQVLMIFPALPDIFSNIQFSEFDTIFWIFL